LWRVVDYFQVALDSLQRSPLNFHVFLLHTDHVCIFLVVVKRNLPTLSVTFATSLKFRDRLTLSCVHQKSNLFTFFQHCLVLGRSDIVLFVVLNVSFFCFCHLFPQWAKFFFAILVELDQPLQLFMIIFIFEVGASVRAAFSFDFHQFFCVLIQILSCLVGCFDFFVLESQNVFCPDAFWVNILQYPMFFF